MIRRDTLAAAGHRCSICGSAWEPLRCLCKWRFSDIDAVAKLEGFAALCLLCDAALHLVGAVRFGRVDLTIRQLSRVNGISLAEAQHLLERSLRVWSRRNQRKWHLTISASLLERYSQLSVLVSASRGRQVPEVNKCAGVMLRRQLERDIIGIPPAGEDGHA